MKETLLLVLETNLLNGLIQVDEEQGELSIQSPYGLLIGGERLYMAS